MAVNKNVVKIGLRVFAAVTLIYLIYNLIPTSAAPPIGSSPQHEAGSGFVKDHGSIPHLPPPSKPEVSYPYRESVVANPDPFPGAGHAADVTGLGSTTSSALLPTSTAVDLSHDHDTPTKSSPKWATKTYTDPLKPTAVKHVTLTNTQSTEAPTILVCVMTKDGESWGNDARNFSSFLRMLDDTEIDPTTLSLCLLTSSEEEYEVYRRDTKDTKFADIHIMQHPGYKDFSGSRGNRHDGGIQHARRVEMARLRNYATLSSLSYSHEHILWIDADVFELSTGLIQSMLNFSTSHPQVGIQTAISLLGDGDGDYDWNAWRGERSIPSDKEREKLRKDKGSWQASSVGDGKSKHMGDLRDELKKKNAKLKQTQKYTDDFYHGETQAFDPSTAEFDEDEDEPSDSAPTSKGGVDEIPGLFRLDAVGATVLMMKASLWRQGLSFATSYLVGTDWKDEGWDGVESEGLCMTVRNLINEEYGRLGGVGCWGVADGWSRHAG